MADLHALAIPRLQEPNALTRERPNIPLSELTDRRITGLLAIIDQWIHSVRAYAAEDDEQAQGTLGPADNAD